VRSLKELDGFQLLGWLVSAVIGLGFGLYKADPIGGTILGLTLAIGVQLLDAQRRQSESEDRIVRAIGVSPTLCRDDEMLDALKRIIDDCISIKALEFDFFARQARIVLDECRASLDPIADGYLKAPLNSQSSYSRHIFTEAKRGDCIKATATGDIGWLSTPGSDTYVQLNVDAAARGVRITRTFMFRKAEMYQIKELLRKELVAKIQLFWVDPSSLDASLRKDFLIMIDRLAIEVQFGPDGHGREEMIYVARGKSQATVQRFVIDYEQLMLHPEPITGDWIATLEPHIEGGQPV
jgi:hypothetical protein